MTYSDKLKDPRWHAKANEVKRLAWNKCDTCGCDDAPMDAHHKYYDAGREPWDYPLTAFQCLCRPCHEQMTIAIRDLLAAIGGLPHWEIAAFTEDFGRAVLAGHNPHSLIQVARLAIEEQ